MSRKGTKLRRCGAARLEKAAWFGCYIETEERVCRKHINGDYIEENVYFNLMQSITI